MWGPFYRYELTKERVAQARAGWLYGTTPDGGIEPTVQAYTFRMEGKKDKEVKFCTGIEPDKGGGGGQATWRKSLNPGVIVHDEYTVKIRIHVVN